MNQPLELKEITNCYRIPFFPYNAQIFSDVIRFWNTQVCKKQTSFSYIIRPKLCQFGSKQGLSYIHIWNISKFKVYLVNKYQTHCVKSVCIRSFSSPYFPSFGLNTERYSLSLRIQSKCTKIRAKKTPNTDTFHAVPFFTQKYETTLFSARNVEKEKRKKAKHFLSSPS